MENKILIVEDSIVDSALIKAILSDQQLYFANDGIEAFEVIDRVPDIELMILDINMPRMNGFEVLEKLKSDDKYSKIVSLILTNHDELENEIKGLSLGAVDYIRKPLNLESLRKRIDIHSELKMARKILERDNRILEETVNERTKEVLLTRSITIHALITLLEIRDLESGNHTLRTQYYIKAICEELAKKDKYKDILTEEYIKEIFDTAPLHDIGKVGVPDRILLKPGKLTQEEFEIMKLHVDHGLNAIKVNSDVMIPSFIKTATEIISSHHEYYNGLGYPKGLKGEEIPIAARLMAFADVYDALINKRVYKEAFLHEDAMKIIKDKSGIQFDPEIVEAFVAIEDKIIEISNTYKAK